MTVNIRLTIFFVLVSLSTGLAVGYLWGAGELGGERGAMHVRPAQTTGPAATAPHQEQMAGASQRDSGLRATHDELLSLLQQSQWYQLEQWLEQRGQQLTPQEQQGLIAGLRKQVNKYDAVAMRRVLRTYMVWFPSDVEAVFLISDLQQVEGLAEAALGTLLSVMNGGFDAAAVARARVEADRIISAITSGLKNRGATVELEAFWQHVSQSYPVSDYYRYEWARALAALKNWQEARRVLAETSTSDVSQASLDELAESIDQAEQGLQFRRQGDRLLAAVRGAQGAEYTLLVDTGANITSLSRQALRGLRAVPAGQKVSVRTAGGVVETSVYRVAYMEVQGRVVEDVRVLQLPAELPGMDGLLGTDLLRKLNWAVDNL